MKKYKVECLQGDTYQVFWTDQHYEASPVFQGSLADCDAYVNLKQNENVEF